MGAPALGFTATRLKREDCRRTRHDSSFSKWKILIGASDWEEHSIGKEGAERYRIQNLPVSPGPGVYEIGVGVWAGHSGSGRDLGKLDPDRVVVVYLGQAENVRSRLQSYGRGGAHLDNASSTTGLFKHVFSRGFPILYRWAPMMSKKDAERTEAELLAHFDYAWNKVINGMKRPTDALLKIDEVLSSATAPKVLKMLKSLTERKVGIPIKPSIQTSVQGGDYKFGFLARVLKFGRNQPRAVVPRDDDDDSIGSNACGVNLSDGMVCRNQRVEGRKRCADHKGKKKNASSNPSNVVNLDSASKQSPIEGVDSELFVPICGVILLDGSPCTKNPVAGRKRCEEHKGKRIQALKLNYQASTIEVDLEKSMEKESMSRTSNGGNCCGVVMSCGSCTREPVKGRKRCEEHKGMRIHYKLI